MDDIDTREFIQEREDRLGGKLTLRTYCTFFAELGGEKREYGVFLYSDGKTLVLEDFERVPSIMGIPLTYNKKKKEEYVKLERMWDINEIQSIDQVPRTAAESSLKRIQDVSKPANAFDKAFKKLVTRIKLVDGQVLYLEMMSHKDFASWVEKNKNK